MSRYVLDAVLEQLRRDVEAQDLLALTARADPVLAELWNNHRTPNTTAHKPGDVVLVGFVLPTNRASARLTPPV